MGGEREGNMISSLSDTNHRECYKNIVQPILDRVEDLQTALEEGTKKRDIRENLLLSRVEILESHQQFYKPLLETVAGVEEKVKLLEYHGTSSDGNKDDIEDLQESVMNEVKSILRNFKTHLQSVEQDWEEKQQIVADSLSGITTRLEVVETKTSNHPSRLNLAEQRLATIESKLLPLNSLKEKFDLSSSTVEMDTVIDLRKRLSDIESNIQRSTSAHNIVPTGGPTAADGIRSPEIQFQPVSSGLEERIKSQTSSMLDNKFLDFSRSLKGGESNLEKRMDNLENTMTRQLSGLENIVMSDERDFLLEKFESRLESMETQISPQEDIKLEVLSSRVGNIERAMSRLDDLDVTTSEADKTSRLERLSLRLEQLEKTIDEKDLTFGRVSTKFDSLARSLQEEHSSPRVDDLQVRVQGLEVIARDNSNIQKLATLEEQVRSLDRSISSAPEAVFQYNQIQMTITKLQETVSSCSTKLESSNIDRRVSHLEKNRQLDNFEELKATVSNMEFGIRELKGLPNRITAIDRDLNKQVREITESARNDHNEVATLSKRVEHLTTSIDTDRNEANKTSQRSDQRISNLEISLSEFSQTSPFENTVSRYDHRIASIERNLNEIPTNYARTADITSQHDSLTRKLQDVEGATSLRIAQLEKSHVSLESATEAAETSISLCNKNISVLEQNQRDNSTQRSVIRFEQKLSALEAAQNSSNVNRLLPSMEVTVARHEQQLSGISDLEIKMDFLEQRNTTISDDIESYLNTTTTRLNTEFCRIEKTYNGLSERVTKLVKSDDHLSRKVSLIESDAVKLESDVKQQINNLTDESRVRMTSDNVLENQLLEKSMEIDKKLQTVTQLEHSLNEATSSGGLRGRVSAIEKLVAEFARGKSSQSTDEKIRNLNDCINGCYIDMKQLSNTLHDCIEDIRNTSNLAYEKASSAATLNKVDVSSLTDAVAAINEERRTVSLQHEVSTKQVATLRNQVSSLQSVVKTIEPQLNVMYSDSLRNNSGDDIQRIKSSIAHTNTQLELLRDELASEVCFGMVLYLWSECFFFFFSKSV